MSYTIRLGLESEKVAITELVNQSYKQQQKCFIESPTARTTCEKIEELIIKKELFVLAENNEIVGTVFVEKNDNYGSFGLLSISEKKQGQGLGAKLIQFAEQHVQRHACNIMQIVVMGPAKRLIAFYERQGYAQKEQISWQSISDQIVKAEYSKEAYYVLMQKQLKPSNETCYSAAISPHKLPESL